MKLVFPLSCALATFLATLPNLHGNRRCTAFEPQEIAAVSSIPLLLTSCSKLTSPRFIGQVLGNAKGVAAVIISILVFRNPFTLAGSLGYVITVAGVFLYYLARRRATQLAGAS